MAYLFGSGDGLQLTGDSATLPENFPVTVVAWVYPTDLSSAMVRGYVCTNTSSTPNKLLGIAVRGDTNDDSNAILWENGLKQVFGTASAWVENQWQHLAVRFLNGSMHVYRNGAFENSDTHSVSIPFSGTQRWDIGFRDIAEGSTPSPSAHFIGRLAEVAVYNGDIGAPRIASLAKGFVPRLIYPQLLSHYFPLRGHFADVKTGESLTEISGSSVAAADHPPTIEYAPPIIVHTKSQFVTVGAIAAGTDALGPDRVDQTVDLAALAAGTAILAPAVDRAIDVGSIAAGTAALAPSQVDQTVDAPAVPAAAAVLAPARVDQTTDVGAEAAGTAIVAPSAVASQSVTVGVMAAGTAVLGPDAVHQTLGLEPIAARADVLAPSAEHNVAVGAIAAGTAVVAPVQVDRTVFNLQPIQAATATLAPGQIDQTLAVPAVAARAATAAPRVDRAVAVPAAAAATAVLAPTAVYTQDVLVGAIPAGAAILAPARIDQTAAPAVAEAGTDAPAPRVDRALDVGAAAAGTAALAPVRVDLTVDVQAVQAGSQALAPRVDREIDVGAIVAGTAILAPHSAFDQSVAIGAIAAATAIPAPSTTLPPAHVNFDLTVAAAGGALTVAAAGGNLTVAAANVDVTVTPAGGSLTV